MKTLGQSSNFIIQIDETNYSATEQQDLTNLVNSVYLTSFESDYNTLCGWYGVATNKVLGLTNKAVVTFGNQSSGAGSTSGYSPTGIWIKISTLIGGTDHRLSTFAHELNHIMEGYKKNWTVTNSQGEGLCRAVADLLHPLPGSDEVNAWLAFDPTTDPTSAKADTEFRKDWVSVSFNGRVFQQRIGLPPKYFSRLVRFAQAWIIKEQQPGCSWIKIAYECGYFDQMHLIHDFQEFAGVNPSAIESELLNSPTKFFNRLFC